MNTSLYGICCYCMIKRPFNNLVHNVNMFQTNILQHIYTFMLILPRQMKVHSLHSSCHSFNFNSFNTDLTVAHSIASDIIFTRVL